MQIFVTPVAGQMPWKGYNDHVVPVINAVSFFGQNTYNCGFNGSFLPVCKQSVGEMVAQGKRLCWSLTYPAK
jgi:hypothetical protein